MAKRKNKKNRGTPDGGVPNDGAFEPTEGFGDTGGYTDHFEPIPGGTEDMLTEHSEVPPGELDELDDVLVLLPEEDEPVSQDSVAFFATESLGDSISEEPLLPITDAGTGEIPLTEDAYGSGSYGITGGPTDAVPTDAVPTDAVPTDAVPTMSGTSISSVTTSSSSRSSTTSTTLPAAAFSRSQRMRASALERGGSEEPPPWTM